MRSVKEASALALAEGEAGVRPGQVASIARAKLGAGASEEATADALTPEPVDGPAQVVASQLLEDMQAGLRLHRRLLEARTESRKALESPDQRG
jgi:hypothetical protein